MDSRRHVFHKLVAVGGAPDNGVGAVCKLFHSGQGVELSSFQGRTESEHSAEVNKKIQPLVVGKAVHEFRRHTVKVQSRKLRRLVARHKVRYFFFDEQRIKKHVRKRGTGTSVAVELVKLFIYRAHILGADRARDELHAAQFPFSVFYAL